MSAIHFLSGNGNGSASGSGSSGDAKLQETIISNVAVGATPVGTEFANNMTFTQYVKKTHVANIGSTIALTSTVSGGLFEKGTTQSVTKLAATITKNSAKEIISIDWYKNDTVIQTTTCDSLLNYNININDSISEDTIYKAILKYKNKSGATATTKSEVEFEFVGATYIGGVDNIPTIDAVKGLTKIIKKAGESNNKVNVDNQYVVFAYPASFGNLTSIKDGNNFENISDFNKISLTINEMTYNVYYTTTKKTLSNFTYIFK